MNEDEHLPSLVECIFLLEAGKMTADQVLEQQGGRKHYLPKRGDLAKLGKMTALYRELRRTGSIVVAARKLGIPRSTAYAYLRAYQLLKRTS